MVECLTRDPREAGSSQKDSPCLIERLLMGRKESNLTNKQYILTFFFFLISTCRNPSNRLVSFGQRTYLHHAIICENTSHKVTCRNPSNRLVSFGQRTYLHHAIICENTSHKVRCRNPSNRLVSFGQRTYLHHAIICENTSHKVTYVYLIVCACASLKRSTCLL